MENKLILHKRISVCYYIGFVIARSSLWFNYISAYNAYIERELSLNLHQTIYGFINKLG